MSCHQQVRASPMTSAGDHMSGSTPTPPASILLGHMAARSFLAYVTPDAELSSSDEDRSENGSAEQSREHSASEDFSDDTYEEQSSQSADASFEEQSSGV